MDELIEKASDRLLELVEQGIPLPEAINKVWAEFRIPAELYENAKLASLKETATRLGLSLKNDAVQVEQAYARLVDQSKTRLYIERASARLRVAVEKSVRDSIKAGESIQASAVRIQENALRGSSPDLVRKEINDLARNPITKRQAKALRRRIDAGVKGDLLNASYQRVIDVAENRGPEAVRKELRQVAKDKMRSEALRVANTESERAYYASETEKIAQDPDAKYVKIRLNPDHKIPCICDAVTSADMGYGKGVYPRDSAPELPLHPNCGCFITPVFVNNGIRKKTAQQVIADKGFAGKVTFINIQPKT